MRAKGTPGMALYANFESLLENENDMDDLMRNDQKDDDDNSKVDHLVPFRDQLRKALQSKQSMGYKGSGKEKQGFSLGTIMDLTNCLLNIMLAALYIASTYKPHELAM